MRKRNALIIVAVVAFLALPAAAADETPATIGEFSVELAGMLTGKHYDTTGAQDILGKLGIELQGPLDSDVDHAYLIEALGQAGFRLTTETPDRAVTRDELDSLAGMLQIERSGPKDPCPPGFPGQSCNSVQCKGGDNHNDFCTADADCPGGFCKVPPGIGNKIASPTQG